MSLHLGDSFAILDQIESDSIDGMVTDPPAGISVLGNLWDDPMNLEGKADDQIGYAKNPLCKTCHKYKRGWRNKTGCLCKTPDFDAHDRQTMARDSFIAWLEKIMTKCLRVVKPGGYALVWSIPKTSHWTSKALENAGWQLCGSVAHVFSQGLPKSFNVALAIDKLTNKTKALKEIDMEQLDGVHDVTTMSAEAQQWIGWGTSLKPAYERWILVRKAGNIKSERTPPSFFYCSKTAKSEKNAGDIINDHPTVKSLKLMTMLIKSIASNGDIIIDPFMGSGSTIVACALNGYRFVGIEKEEQYFNIAQSRLKLATSEIVMDSF